MEKVCTGKKSAGYEASGYKACLKDLLDKIHQLLSLRQ